MTKEECEIETSKALMEMKKSIVELKNEKCELLGIIQDKDKVIRELEYKLEQTEKDLQDYQFNYPTIKELEKEKDELKEILKKYSAMKIVNEHI